jgi:hypothetical protein
VSLVVEEGLHDDVVAPGGHADVADLRAAGQPLGDGLQPGQQHRDADDRRHRHADRPRGGDGDHVDQPLVDQPGDPLADRRLGDLQDTGDVGVAGAPVALQQPDDLAVDLVDHAPPPLVRGAGALRGPEAMVANNLAMYDITVPSH